MKINKGDYAIYKGTRKGITFPNKLQLVKVIDCEKPGMDDYICMEVVGTKEQFSDWKNCLKPKERLTAEVLIDLGFLPTSYNGVGYNAVVYKHDTYPEFALTKVNIPVFLPIQHGMPSQKCLQDLSMNALKDYYEKFPLADLNSLYDWLSTFEPPLFQNDKMNFFLKYMNMTKS